MGYHMDMWVEDPVRIPEELIPKLADKMLEFYTKQAKEHGGTPPVLEKGEEFSFVQKMLQEHHSFDSARVGVGGLISWKLPNGMARRWATGLLTH